MTVIHLSYVLGVLAILVAGSVCLVVSRLPAIPAAILALAAVTTGVACVALTYPWCQRKYEANVESKKLRRQGLEKRLAALVSPTCCTHDRLAIAYGGWQGTVHTFYFLSQQYELVFRKANATKCF